MDHVDKTPRPAITVWLRLSAASEILGQIFDTAGIVIEGEEGTRWVRYDQDLGI